MIIIHEACGIWRQIIELVDSDTLDLLLVLEFNLFSSQECLGDLMIFLLRYEKI